MKIVYIPDVKGINNIIGISEVNFTFGVIITCDVSDTLWVSVKGVNSVRGVNGASLNEVMGKWLASSPV